MARDYKIAKTAGQCLKCRRELTPGDPFVATVREGDEEFLREDYCPACWESAGDVADDPNVFGVWHSQVPEPAEKKRLFVDDELLINFFERLADAEEDNRINFRFVLALVLMRKKLLVYDRAEKDESGRDVWLMHFKGDDAKHAVIDPHMDEEKIAAVSGQLGEIMEGEL